MPYPYEDPNFPANAIQDYINSGINAYSLKYEQERRRRDAVAQFKKDHPFGNRYID